MGVTLRSRIDAYGTVLRRLGWPFLHVELLGDSQANHEDELTEADLRNLKVFADETDRWFLRGFGQLKEATASWASNGQREIDVVPDCAYIVDVYLPDLTDGVDRFPFVPGENAYFPYTYRTPPPGFSYSEIQQRQASRKQGLEILGAERSWEWVPSTRKLRLYPASSPTMDGGTLVYLYSTNEVDYHVMTPYQEEKYLDYLEVKMKYALGRIRSKYPQGAPGAGGVVQLDGAQLLEEAQQKEQELELIVMNLPVPFFAG